MRNLSKEKVIELIQSGRYFEDTKVIEYRYYPDVKNCFSIYYLDNYGYGNLIMMNLNEEQFVKYIKSRMKEIYGNNVSVILTGYQVQMSYKGNMVRRRKK